MQKRELAGGLTKAEESRAGVSVPGLALEHGEGRLGERSEGQAM